VIPLYDVEVEVRVSEEVQGVTCVLGGEALAFERGAKYVRFVVPRVEGHQMIEIAFAG